MRKLPMSRLVVATWVLVALSPWGAQAEMAGQQNCSNPSWNILAAGECAPSGSIVVDVPRSAASPGAVQLVTDPVILPGVPEPETYLLMLAGLAGLTLARRLRRRD
jgi:PEP-CTERM motif